MELRADERPGPVALGLLGLPWADGAGMTRLPPQPPDNLDHAAASILEPEVPAGGISLVKIVVATHEMRMAERQMSWWRVVLLAALAATASVLASSLHGVALDAASLIVGSLAGAASYASLPKKNVLHRDLGLAKIPVEP
jgi:hypothetical protein